MQSASAISLKLAQSFVSVEQRLLNPNPHNLPSWTPDISQRFVSVDLPPIYHADLNLTSVAPQVTAGKLLRVSGCECDIVTSVEPLWRSKDDFLSFIKAYGWTRVGLETPYPTGISRKLAVMRSLVFDFSDDVEAKRLEPFSEEAQLIYLMALASIVSYPENHMKSVFEDLSILSDQPMNAILQDFLPEHAIKSDWDKQDKESSLCLVHGHKISEQQSLWSFIPMNYVRVFQTQKGYLGVGPIGVNERDIVSVLEVALNPLF